MTTPFSISDLFFCKRYFKKTEAPINPLLVQANKPFKNAPAWTFRFLFEVVICIWLMQFWEILQFDSEFKYFVFSVILMYYHYVKSESWSLYKSINFEHLNDLYLANLPAEYYLLHHVQYMLRRYWILGITFLVFCYLLFDKFVLKSREFDETVIIIISILILSWIVSCIHFVIMWRLSIGAKRRLVQFIYNHILILLFSAFICYLSIELVAGQNDFNNKQYVEFLIKAFVILCILICFLYKLTKYIHCRFDMKLKAKIGYFDSRPPLKSFILQLKEQIIPTKDNGNLNSKNFLRLTKSILYSGFFIFGYNWILLYFNSIVPRYTSIYGYMRIDKFLLIQHPYITIKQFVEFFMVFCCFYFCIGRVYKKIKPANLKPIITYQRWTIYYTFILVLIYILNSAHSFNYYIPANKAEWNYFSAFYLLSLRPIFIDYFICIFFWMLSCYLWQLFSEINNKLKLRRLVGTVFAIPVMFVYGVGLKVCSFLGQYMNDRVLEFVTKRIAKEYSFLLAYSHIMRVVLIYLLIMLITFIAILSYFLLFQINSKTCRPNKP